MPRQIAGAVGPACQHGRTCPKGGAIRQTGTEAGGEDWGDPTRRTHLANERTYLAWWRSGLTALAVAVGVGRLVPELGGGGGGTRAVSAAAGVGFGLLGLFFIVYAGVRARAVRLALERREFSHPDGRVLAVVGIAGTLLGLLTIAIVLEGL